MAWSDYIPGFLRFGQKDQKGSEGPVLIDKDGREKTSEHVTQGFDEFGQTYNGEKSWGNLGPAKNMKLDLYSLRRRGWQFYLTSDVAHSIISRFIEWVLGEGLRITPSPRTEILEDEGIKLDDEKFRRKVHSRWTQFASSKRASHDGLSNLHELAQEAYKSALNGGDVLVIQRVRSGRLTTELVDGKNIETPPGMFFRDNVKDGVHIDKKGRHLGFYVRTAEVTATHKYIPAKGGNTGLQFAFLVYGAKYSLNDTRGMPILSPVFESISKLDRYKEAVLGSAEEREKVPYQIRHDLNATGEHPTLERMMGAVDKTNGQQIAHDDQGKQHAKSVEATTEKTTINNPPGTYLEQLDSGNETNFKDYFPAVLDTICSSPGIPSEVALSKFEQNFSSSRASLKQWEHRVKLARSYFVSQFYERIYENWLTWEILSSKIEAPRYVEAMTSDNVEVLEAYRTAKFDGPSVPHIDPLKEVKAEREKLGAQGKNLPLTSYWKAVESLNEGENSNTLKEFGETISEAEENGIDKPSENEGQASSNDPNEDPDGNSNNDP